MQRLNFLLVIFLLHSCNGNGQANTNKDDNIKGKSSFRYSIKLNDDRLVIKNSDSILLYNSKNLIRNFDLLSTSLYNGNTTNDFFLVYQNNASVRKTQSSFHYYLSKNNLFLISKEEVNFDGKNIYISKNYTIPINVMNLDYEAVDEKIIISNIKSSVILKNKLESHMLFNNKSAFNLSFNYTPKEYFSDYPINTLKIGSIKILDIKNSNNIAYYLEQGNLYDEAIYILISIIQEDSTRVVAYLNLADAYWEIGEKTKAKDNYKKYVELMKSQNKDLKKIPKYVWERTH